MNRKIIIIILFILLLGVSVYAYNSNRTSKNPHGPNITSSDRVLIFAPHPDDETIATAGVIRYCLENNIPVSVVVVTNGGIGELGVTRLSLIHISEPTRPY